MKLAGTYEFNASPEKVWQTLTDPQSLSACIPGCDKMEAQGNDEYTATVTIAMGPIRGKFDATVKVNKSSIAVGGKAIKVFAERDPANLPWGALDIDVKPLKISGRLGEQVDPVLVDGDPVAMAQVGAHGTGELVRACEDGRHHGPPSGTGTRG